MIKQKKSPAETGPGTQNLSDTMIITDFDEITKHLIPLKGKIPDISKGDTWKRSFDDGEFPAGCNFGLRLGEEAEWGYLTVIDYDGPEHFLDFLSFLQEKGVSTDTVAVKTGGKHNGYHLYYWADKPFIGRFKGQYEGVDVEILGEGCYTVIPPSKVASDYQVVEAFTEKEPITYQVSNARNFLDEIERAAEISFTRLEIIQESLEQESAPSNLYTNYLVHFSLISSDLLLWETVLNDSYKNIYNEELHLSKSLRFKCVFHQEKNPSAGLHFTKRWFVYHDFHDGKSFDIVEVFHALKHQKPPEFLEAKNSRKWLDALLELYEWIDENNITTGFGEKFDRWRDGFLGNLRLTGGGSFKEYITDTLETILGIARERINKGINELVLSKRFVAERMNWTGSDNNKAKIVNRAMNFLVFSGLLQKGRDLGTKNGRTYIFSIDFEITTAMVEKAWSELVKAGLTNYRDFNKSNVADFFGAQVANRVFRASAIEREGMQDEIGVQNEVSERVHDGSNRSEQSICRDRFGPPGKPHHKSEHFESSGGRMGNRAGFRSIREQISIERRSYT